MTVISSLFSGISGIVANGSALSVAGDNIANMSTPAFKASVPVFESALSQRIGEAEVGLGARLAGTTANFSQGAFANTTRATDLAVQGKGFFVVRNDAGDQYYTRAGSFETDSDGDLVTSAGGLRLQGYAIDDSGQVSGSLSGINFESVSSAPVATDEIVFNMNLDADASTASLPAWSSTSFANASASSNFSYSQTIYDSLGNPRTITTFFRKGTVGATQTTWNAYTMTLGSNLANWDQTQAEPALSEGTVIVSQATLTFDNDDGQLASVVFTPGAGEDGSGNLAAGDALDPDTYGLRWSGANTILSSGAAVPVIAHDFGQSSGDGTVTMFSAADSTIKSVVQNGRPQGELQSFEVIADGTVRGNFSNGDSRDLYKVPLATFANDNGLTRSGSNLYAESGTSGQSQIGLASSAGRGELRAFSIEQSNVDLASEFVRIITFQRAFQASSRTVSTAAELLQDLVNLGR